MSGYISGISPSLRDLVVPVVDIFADGTDFNDGSSTYIDLSATPGSENSVTIAFDGVYQNHDTFSISGVRVTFDAAIPTGTSKIEARYAQENRNYTTIADDAVTLAKMASGTDGNLLTYDASGNPAHVATGSDGQVLTSAGAGAPPAFEALAGGGYSLVSTINASSSTTVDISNMESGYDYLINVTMWKGSTGITMYGYLGVSGPTYRTANYRGMYAVINYAGTSAASQVTDRIPMFYTAASGDANEESFCRIELFDPANASVKTQWFMRAHTNNASNNQYWVNSQGKYLTAEANTDFRFYVSARNIASGIFKIYRRPNA